MAIDYKAGQAPKGPSNSNPMASTPGTQQSALQNVGGLNLNPNMPAGPQMQKRGRSSFQQSVMPTPAPQTTSTPLAGGRARQQPGRTGSPTVSRGLPMDPGRGYNVFSGMDANQISDMNRTMGMSNMTALPPVNPALSGMGLKPGEMAVGQSPTGWWTNFKKLFTGPGETPNYWDKDVVIDGPTGDVFYDQDAWGEAVQDAYDKGETISFTDWYNTPTPEEVVEPEPLPPGDPDPNTFEEGIYDLYDTSMTQEIGAALDQKYAFQLQSVLAGLDRQAAMMGTLGSPAHTSMINTAISGALENMAAEYADSIAASRAEEAGILGAIGDIEDGLAGSEEMRMVANSIFEQDVFAPSIATYSAYPPRQKDFFMGVTDQLKAQFQKEYSSAANQAQRDAIVDKYRGISNKFQTLLVTYAKKDALGYTEFQANADLNAIFASAGLYTGEDEESGAYISF